MSAEPGDLLAFPPDVVGDTRSQNVNPGRLSFVDARWATRFASYTIHCSHTVWISIDIRSTLIKTMGLSSYVPLEQIWPESRALPHFSAKGAKQNIYLIRQA